MTLTPPAGADLPSIPESLMRRVGTMKTTGNNRYKDADTTWQRVSNLLKNLDTDTFNLDLWKKRQVAIGMSKRPDLVLGVAAAEQYGDNGKLTDDSKAAINGLCKQAMDAAASKAGANRGTAVHTATERLDLGETVEQIGLPYPFDADLRAYAALRDAMGLVFEPQHIERSVRVSAVGAVGSYDRIGRSSFLVEQGFIAPEQGVIVDVKTEDNPLLNLLKIAPQLACYANGDGQWVPEPTAEDAHAGHYEPMPDVSKAVALVIHVRAGRAVPFLIDITAGWQAALGAAEQRTRVAEAKLGLGEPGAWALPLDVPQAPLAQFVQKVAAPRLESDRQALEAPTPPEPTLEQMLLQAIGQAGSLDTLAELFTMAEQRGVAWVGTISDAGIMRAKIVQCVQRDMHNPATTGKCACGWTRDMAP